MNILKVSTEGPLGIVRHTIVTNGVIKRKFLISTNIRHPYSTRSITEYYPKDDAFLRFVNVQFYV